MNEEAQAAQLLGIVSNDESPFIRYRNGARTRAVLATQPGITHRFSDQHPQVVAKLYKGKGDTAGSRAYQQYHSASFHSIDTLVNSAHIQQSLTAGVIEGIGPYAVLQFVEGGELAEILERRDLDAAQASRIVQDILVEIWIPLWHAGLRFKDCHPGNYVLTPGCRVVMIDTEQMRKDAEELLNEPDNWMQRNKHQEAGLSRLPRLVSRVINATRPDASEAAVLRNVKSKLKSSNLTEALRSLGRAGGAVQQAERAVSHLLGDLREKGYLA